MGIARSCLCACSTLALIAGGVAPALAQEADDEGQMPATAEGVTEDGAIIIVTAQKREESIQDVPIAVTAISGEGLDDYKIETGAELLRAVPNVNFSKSNFSM